eukprot:scaffold8341_cov66-Cyclotella_meneghiniana.AAC.2
MAKTFFRRRVPPGNWTYPMANNNGQDECEYATLNWRREIPTAALTIGDRLWSMESRQNAN